MKDLLILSANPSDTSRLHLEKEVREIKESLKRTQSGLTVHTYGAIRIQDLRRALLEVKPQMLHFSGHGEGEQGLLLEAENARKQAISTSALEGLFELFSDTIQCVVLNACYSEVQAEAIHKHIPYVIGMNAPIADRAAIVFSVVFYDAVGSGESIEFAYKLACNAIQFENLASQHLVPVLLKREQPELKVNQPHRCALSLRESSLLQRQNMLFDKLSRLEEVYDLETRIDEKMRLEQTISMTRKTLEQVEAELQGFN